MVVQPKSSPAMYNTNDSILSIVATIHEIIAADSGLTPAHSKKERENGANSIASLTAGDIQVYLNPVKEQLNVKFKGSVTAEGCSFQLYDGEGRLFSANGSMQLLTEVNMQSAKKRLYYLVVVDKSGKRLYRNVVKK